MTALWSATRSARFRRALQRSEERRTGDFAIMPPAHDAWIAGDDPCAVVDWQGFADYGKAA